MTKAGPTRFVLLTAAAVLLALVVVLGALLTRSSSSPPASTLSGNPNLDPGTTLTGVAPHFTLTDQFGAPASLSSYKGKVVILAFNDSECTTICPLTTSAMVDAKAMLGAAGSQVQLLGIDANPTATAVSDVRSYSEAHGMMHQWRFLTGSVAQLKQVWQAYKIDVAIEQGQIDHTPALFVIDPQGRLAKLYLTQQSYAAIGQLGQLLAEEAASLLPGHPQVNSKLSYKQIPGIAPTQSLQLPRAGGGTVALGPGHGARLYLFFATWDQQVTDLRAQLDALNDYSSSAAAAGLPALSAVDEGSVEPSPGALPAFLRTVPGALTYPVGIDTSGRVADGYEVQDEPWLVLMSSSGQILWYYDVSTSGWLSAQKLTQHVQSALSHPPKSPSSLAAAQAQLAGSPPPLAALHAQASQLLGADPALLDRIKALRGYPIVVNVWASYCAPCQAEFGLLESASARYGSRVAFLGADYEDSSGDAQAFLHEHPVTYPSYQSGTGGIQEIIPQGLLGMPTTIYIDRAGKVVFVHAGEYDAQGTLDADIDSYALS
jgi:cytochrome oxidase Cu insertion factor (SCO1/SenC/PrrC family)/thiol-disulfide isomerase/thioredoxin